MRMMMLMNHDMIQQPVSASRGPCLPTVSLSIESGLWTRACEKLLAIRTKTEGLGDGKGRGHGAPLEPPLWRRAGRRR